MPLSTLRTLAARSTSPKISIQISEVPQPQLCIHSMLHPFQSFSMLLTYLWSSHLVELHPPLPVLHTAHQFICYSELKLTRLTWQIDLRTKRSLKLAGVTCLTCMWIDLCLCSLTLILPTVQKHLETLYQGILLPSKPFVHA